MKTEQKAPGPLLPALVSFKSAESPHHLVSKSQDKAELKVRQTCGPDQPVGQVPVRCDLEGRDTPTGRTDSGLFGMIGQQEGVTFQHLKMDTL